MSLEGYLVGRIFSEALRRAAERVTLEGFVDAAESISDLDLGIETPIHYDRNRHQATSRVWGTMLDSSASYRVLPLNTR